MRYLLVVATLSALLPSHTILVESPLEVRTDPIEEVLMTVPMPLIRVAFCESSFRHFNSSGEVLTNENRNGSADYGLYQINSIHLPEAEKLGIDIKSLEGNVEFALHLYNKRGLKDWSASRHCWSKLTRK